jgi:hypothetical protein
MKPSMLVLQQIAAASFADQGVFAVRPLNMQQSKNMAAQLVALQSVQLRLWL